MHAAIADLETKKLHAEKELIEFEKASSRSEGVLHHLAAQRFASVIDIQLLASRATTEMKGLEKASDEEVGIYYLSNTHQLNTTHTHTHSTTFVFVYYPQPTKYTSLQSILFPLSHPPTPPPALSSIPSSVPPPKNSTVTVLDYAYTTNISPSTNNCSPSKLLVKIGPKIVWRTKR